jgi:hypothetical protein
MPSWGIEPASGEWCPVSMAAGAENGRLAVTSPTAPAAMPSFSTSRRVMGFLSE